MWLKMNRRVVYIFVVVIVGVMFWKLNSETQAEVVGAQPALDSEVPAEAQTSSTSGVAEIATPAPVVAEVAAPVAEEAQAIRKKFPEILKQVSDCIGAKFKIDSAEIDPTFEKLNDSLRNELGDAIVNFDDWATYRIKLASGEERRIRIETNSEATAEPTRYLRYFKLDNQGLPEAIPLPEDQSTNPSDTLIASLVNEGQVLQKEEGLRKYYQGSEELVISTSNGRISDLEMIKNNRAIKCVNVNSAQAQCRCDISR